LGGKKLSKGNKGYWEIGEANQKFLPNDVVTAWENCHHS